MKLSKLLCGICAIACVLYSANIIAADDSDDPKGHVALDEDVFRVDESEKLSAEGNADDVRTIKISRGQDKKFTCTYHYEDKKIFEKSGVDNVKQLITMDSYSRYKKVDGVIFENVTFDEELMSSLEASGIHLLNIKDLVLNNCKGVKNFEEKFLSLLAGCKSIKSLIISLADKEEFPSGLLDALKDKAKEVNLLCLSFPILTKSAAGSVAKIIENSADHLRTFYLTVRKTDKGILNAISEKMKSVQHVESFAVSFGDVPCENLSKFFDSLAAMKEIKTAKIDLDMNLFVKDGMFATATSLSVFLKNQAMLKELDLSGSNLSATCYSKIFQDGLTDKGHLKIIKLDGVTNITKDNVDKLAKAVTAADSIVEISLVGCKMPQDVFSTLRGAIEGKGSIQVLKLDDNKISDIGGILSKCVNLINVSLQGNQIKEDGMKAMVKSSFEGARQTPAIVNVKDNKLEAASLRNIFNEYTKGMVAKPENPPVAFFIF